MYPPSMVAAACIGTAIDGLTRINNNQWAYQKAIMNRLQELTGLEAVRNGYLHVLQTC